MKSENRILRESLDAHVAGSDDVDDWEVYKKINKVSAAHICFFSQSKARVSIPVRENWQIEI